MEILMKAQANGREFGCLPLIKIEPKFWPGSIPGGSLKRSAPLSKVE